jgi:lysozyme family protein
LLKAAARSQSGYTNHPSDPGGPTKFGITIDDYRRYVKTNATAADVRRMKLDEAKIIYRDKYWNAQRCDELPAGVDYAVFDYGVNSGIKWQSSAPRAQAARQFKCCYRRGRCGGACDRSQTLIVAICDERLRFLQSLRTWPVFGAGWGRRVAEVKSTALAMAADAAKPTVTARNK